MKNRFYNYFFKEFLHYFTIILFTLTAIVWTVQAVNFLDLVTEEGHGFVTYFYFSILNTPKILTKLIPFTFLVAIILTILKLEKDNELIILWTSGLNKIKIVNLIIRISLLVMIFQLLMASAISPTSSNLSRNLIKNSKFQFFPSLLKSKNFNDAVENLTIFVENKNPDGFIDNIFIRDENKVFKDASKSSTIISQSGKLEMNGDQNFLILYNGFIQKEESDGTINIINFDKTTLNLSELTSKSIVAQKIQETSSLVLLECLFGNYFKKYNFSSSDYLSNCTRTEKNYRDIRVELNRRLIMPFYIPLLAMIGCFLLSSKRESFNSGVHKYIYFFIGFIFLLFAELSVRYSGVINFYSMVYYLIPLIIIPLTYLMLFRFFKLENMK